MTNVNADSTEWSRNAYPYSMGKNATNIGTDQSSNGVHHSRKWARTGGGYFIDLYSNTSFQESRSNKRPFLFVGGIHGDEPEGVALAYGLLDWLKTTLDTPTLVHPWFLIPCLNLDGYLANPKQRVNAHGVDLNRNFPAQDWTKDCTGPRYFPGTHPLSEPETDALVQLIEAISPQLIVHFHSYSPACIVYTGSGGELPARFFSKSSNYPVKPDIGYPTPGSLGQYGALKKGVPVICIEEEENIDLRKVWPHFEKGFQELFDWAK